MIDGRFHNKRVRRVRRLNFRRFLTGKGPGRSDSQFVCTVVGETLVQGESSNFGRRRGQPVDGTQSFMLGRQEFHIFTFGREILRFHRGHARYPAQQQFQYVFLGLEEALRVFGELRHRLRAIPIDDLDRNTVRAECSSSELRRGCRTGQGRSCSQWPVGRRESAAGSHQ